MDLAKEKALSHFYTACVKDVQPIERVLHEISDINYSVKLTTSDYVGYTPLHFVIEYNREKVIQLLFDRGADVTIKNGKNETPLHLVASRFMSHIKNYTSSHASSTHNFEVTDLLLSYAHKNNHINPKNDMGLSHFHIACCTNNISVVENFLMHGVDANASINSDSPYLSGYTPLHISVICNNIESVQLLLKYNADTNIVDSRGFTPLHLALQKENNTIIDMIITAQSIDNKSNVVDYVGLSHFHIACMRKDKESVEKFLKQGVSINDPVSFKFSIWAGYTPLHFAIIFNLDFEVTELLLKYGADITLRNARGDPPIYFCKCNEKLKMIVDIVLEKYGLKSKHFLKNVELDELLIACKKKNPPNMPLFDQEATINSSIPSDSPIWPGYSILHIAVEFKSTSIIKILLEQGANINAQDINRFSPVHLAIQKNCKEIVNLLFEFCGETIKNPVDNRGLSHFHIACITHNYNVVKKFLESEVNVNDALASDFTSYNINDLFNDHSSIHHRASDTALHMVCAYEGYGSIVKLLTEQNVDILIQNADNCTPIHIAFKEYMSTFGKRKIEAPDSDASGDEILHYMFIGDFTILDPLLIQSVENAPNINPTDNNGISHFHIACMRGFKVNDFIKNNVDVNASVNSESEICAGYSPLHFAVSRGYYSCVNIVKLLIENGADINAKERKEKTPLSLAVDRTSEDINEDVIEILVNQGADIHSKDSNGMSPFQYALNSDNKRLIYSLLPIANVDRSCPIDDTGFSLIHLACLRGNFKLIKDCLRNGANVNKQISLNSPVWPGYTPLHFLIVTDYSTEFIKILLKSGADCAIKNAEGFSPVHLASKHGEKWKVELLLSNHNKNINPVSCEGISHFHIACSLKDNTKIVESFLRNHVDIDEPVHFFAPRWAGCTPLHIAIDKRSADIIVLLIIHGANVNNNDSCGLTPLHYFCKNYCRYDFNHFKILDMFLEHGADVNAKNVEGNLPVEMASKYNNNNESLLKALSKLSAVNKN